jgi:hypothetical protein
MIKGYLAPLFLVVLACLTIKSAEARSAFEFGDCSPTRFLIYNDDLYDPQISPSIKFDSLEQVPARFSGKIIKYNLKTGARTLIEDQAIPKWVMAFEQNKKYVLLGGKGFTAYNKQSGKFESWHEFDNVAINAIACNEDNIFLGTDQGLIWINSENKKILRTYRKEDGLNSNKISAVYLGKDFLLIGTYRKSGRDYFGMGLFKLDIILNKISSIDLSKRIADPKTKIDLQAYNMVLDIFPLKGEQDWLKIVFFAKWNAWCCDYNYRTNLFKESKNQNYMLERTLAINGQDELSPLAGKLLDYISQEGLATWHGGGLPNFIGEEAVSLIYQRKEFNRLEILLKHPERGTRAAISSYMKGINDPQVQNVFYKILGESEDREIVQISAMSLYHENLAHKTDEVLVKALHAALINLLKKNPIDNDDWQVIYETLDSLRMVKPEIYEECILSQDPNIQSKMPHFVNMLIPLSIGIIADKNKPIELRRRVADALVLGFYYDNKYQEYGETFRKLASDTTEDEAIRANIQKILDRYAQIFKVRGDVHKK